MGARVSRAAPANDSPNSILMPTPIAPLLAGPGPCRHVQEMYVVSEADAAAIRTVFEQDGEFAAAIELRRRFPGITDNEQAREQVRTIAGWAPLPEIPRPVTRLHPSRNR
jgi:hypothetical protein